MNTIKDEILDIIKEINELIEILAENNRQLDDEPRSKAKKNKRTFGYENGV